MRLLGLPNVWIHNDGSKVCLCQVLCLYHKMNDSALKLPLAAPLTTSATGAIIQRKYSISLSLSIRRLQKIIKSYHKINPHQFCRENYSLQTVRLRIFYGWKYFMAKLALICIINFKLTLFATWTHNSSDMASDSETFVRSLSNWKCSTSSPNSSSSDKT